MANTNCILLNIVGDIQPEQLEGRLFQVHVLPGATCIRLYPVTIMLDDRCPVVVAGEQCGLSVGHNGKHCWGRGD